MNVRRGGFTTLMTAALIMCLTTSSCSSVVKGQPIADSTSRTQSNTTKMPTAVDLCRLITPADFPVQGEPSPDFPKLEEKFSPSCTYQLRTGEIGARFTSSLALIPGSKLKQTDFETRREESISGKRVAVGQGAIKGDSSECEGVFDSPVGLWVIVVTDNSAPNRDGCAAVRHVGERVIPRVP